MKNNHYEIPLQKERLLLQTVTPDTRLSTLSVRISEIFCFDFLLLYFPVLLSLSSQLKYLQFFALGYKSLVSCTSNKQRAFSYICVSQT